MKKHLSTLLESSDHLIFYRAQTQYDNLGDLIIILLNKLKHYGAILVDLRGVPDGITNNWNSPMQNGQVNMDGELTI